MNDGAMLLELTAPVWPKAVTQVSWATVEKRMVERI